MMNETLFDALTKSLNICSYEENIEFNGSAFPVFVSAIDDMITFTCHGDTLWLDQKMLSWVVAFFVEKIERQNAVDIAMGTDCPKYEFDKLRKNRVFVDEMLAQLHFNIDYYQSTVYSTKQIRVTFVAKNRKEIMKSLKDRGFFD